MEFDDDWRFDDSPHSHARLLVGELGDLYDFFYDSDEGDESDQFLAFFGGVLAASTPTRLPRMIAEEWVDEWPEIVGASATLDSDQLERVFVGHMKVALNYIIRAGQTASTERDIGWACIVGATQFMGMAWGAVAVIDDRNARATKLGDARHAENRDMRNVARDWYVKRYTQDRITKDAAAELIAGKVVPMKFKTVRKWLAGLQPD